MSEMREYTHDEYKEDMRKLLNEVGLRDAVERRCDRINSLASLLSYVNHAEIQECLCDILYLIELFEQEKPVNRGIK